MDKDAGEQKSDPGPVRATLQRFLNAPKAFSDFTLAST
jgi:hypothetical protein